MTSNEFHRHIKNEDFKTIFEYAYSNCFERIARRILKNSGLYQDVQDAFQEAVIVLNVKATDPMFRLTSNVCAFLSGTSYNKWLKILREKKSKPIVAIDKAPPLQEEDERATQEEKEEIILKIEQGVQTLSALCQRMLRAYYYEGKSMKQIAENEGVAVNTIKQRLHSCRKQLEAII